MNKNRLTQSIIFTLVTLVASINWYLLKKVLDCVGCSNGISWLWVLLTAVIFFALIGISWFLVNAKLVVFMTSLAVVVSYLLVFGFNKIYLVAAVTCLTILYFSSVYSIIEKNARKRINFRKIFNCGMPAVLAAVAILVSVAYYHSPKIVNLKNGIDISMDGYLDEASVEMLQKSYPEFDPEMTVDDFLRMFIGPQPELKMNAVLMEILNIKEEDITNATLYNFRETIADNFGLTLTGEEKIISLIISAVISKVNVFVQNYYQVFAVLLPVSLFFAIKFLGVFLLWLALFVSWLSFRILIKTGAIMIEIEKEPVEVIRVD